MLCFPLINVTTSILIFDEDYLRARRPRIQIFIYRVLQPQIMQHIPIDQMTSEGISPSRGEKRPHETDVGPLGLYLEFTVQQQLIDIVFISFRYNNYIL